MIPVDDAGRLQEAFNLRLEELEVQDIQFLDGCLVPTVAVLCPVDNWHRRVVTYTIDMAGKEFGVGPWKVGDVDPDATMLIAGVCHWGGFVHTC